jgi:plasmid stabilization system protein ParE
MKHFKVTFTPRAEEDLSDMLAYIGQENMENPIEFVDKIIKKVTDTLATMPYSGT